MTDDQAAVRLVVSGRVQGVGFRWFVLREARRMGLAGRVCNLPGGQVEIVVAGNLPDVEKLVHLVSVGPPLARVDSVENTNIPHDLSVPKSFEIG